MTASKRTQLEATLTHWKEAMMLTNAFYSRYKDYRDQADSYESQLRELIDREPLNNADWARLIKRISAVPKEE